MKARQHQGLLCECGQTLDLEYHSDGYRLFCHAPRCKHAGIPHRLPTVELEAIADERPRDH